MHLKAKQDISNFDILLLVVLILTDFTSVTNPSAQEPRA